MHQGNRPQYFWNICFSFCLLLFLTFCIVIIQHHCLKVTSLTTIIKKDLLKRSSSPKDKSQSSQIVTKLRRFEESYCAAVLSAASSVSLLSFHLMQVQMQVHLHSFWFFVAIRRAVRLIVFKKAFLMIRFQCFQSMIILRRKIQISMTFHFFLYSKDRN